MSQNNLMIKKADYEKYQLVLPYRFLFGKRRKNYLSAELEKLHPCFSEEYSFDSDFYRLTKKGIAGEVMVIHKYKLAEYEGQHPVAGSGFYAEDCKHHRFFMSGRMKLCICAGIAFVIAFGILSGSSLRRFLMDQESEAEVKEAGDSGKEFVQTGEAMISSGVEAETNSEAAARFFDAVKADGGRLSFLYWNTDGFRESFEAGISGVYPEALSALYGDAVNAGEAAGAKVLQTVYEKGEPSIQFSVSRRVMTAGSGNQKAPAEKTDKAGKSEFCKALRAELKASGADLKQETFEPYRITFSVPSQNAGRLFSALDSLMTQHGKTATSLKLEQQTAQLEAELSAQENRIVREGVKLELISEYAALFMSSQKNQDAQRQETSAKGASSGAGVSGVAGLPGVPGALKIGEIKDKSGGTVVFYKTREGKIKKVMEVK